MTNVWSLRTELKTLKNKATERKLSYSGLGIQAFPNLSYQHSLQESLFGHFK
jgi:hypothetical protein